MEQQNAYIEEEEKGGHEPAFDSEEEIREIIGELYEPMTEMLAPVLERIRGGMYQLLVGDDSSARLPVYIVRKFINAIYQKKGFPPLQTRFIAGSPGFDRKFDGEKAESVYGHIEALAREHPEIEHVLLVTDTVASGKSLLPIAEALTLENISYDILAVARIPGISDGDPDRTLHSEIHSGGREVPRIYHRDISGVRKSAEKLHAAPARESVANEDEQRDLGERIRISREEAGRVADRLFAHFEGEEEGMEKE